jgi:hypothetical protein
MGIRGTVRRSTDFDFIHANVDIDLIITEEVRTANVKAFEKTIEFFHDVLQRNVTPPSSPKRV